MSIREEKYLPQLLQHHYGIRLQQVEPFEGILKLSTDQGRYVLKRVRKGEKSKWSWLSQFAQETEADFLPVPLLTSKQLPYFDGYHATYVVFPWIEGKCVPLMDPSEWKEISRLLAKFHQATAPFVPEQKVSTCKEEWKRTYQELELYLHAAQWARRSSSFDQTWLKESNYLLGILRNLLQYYDAIDGDTICFQSRKYGRICHFQPDQKNILRDTEGKLILLDWNEMDIGLRTQELAHWILYALERTQNPKIIQSILKGYQEVSPLVENECALLYAQMIFPSKYIRTLRDFYHHQTLSVSQANQHFSELFTKEKNRISFIRVFASYCNNQLKFNIPTIPWLT